MNAFTKATRVKACDVTILSGAIWMFFLSPAHTAIAPASLHGTTGSV